MSVKIQLRRDTFANWQSEDPVLAEGEIALETDSGRFKLGNGSTVYTSLPYGGIKGASGSAIDPFFLYGRV